MTAAVAILLVLVALLETEAIHHRTGYTRKIKGKHSKQDDQPNATTADPEEQANRVLNNNMHEFNLMPSSQDSFNAEIITLLNRLNNEMDALRTQASNLKLQNHLVYKTLRRWQNKCTVDAKPSSAGGATATDDARQDPATAAVAAPQVQLPTTAKQQCPDGYSWNKDLKSCYRFATDRITWRMARERCRAEGADLVSIRSGKEQRFIMDKARKSPDTRHCDFWAGLTDRDEEGQWRWLPDNAALGYTNWNLDEPNNGSGNEHCMHLLWVFNWAWNDAHCNRDNSCYICQIRH